MSTRPPSPVTTWSRQQLLAILNYDSRATVARRATTTERARARDFAIVPSARSERSASLDAGRVVVVPRGRARRRAREADARTRFP
eukprot:31243-Pelagococcus_subviridis.AAC.2